VSLEDDERTLGSISWDNTIKGRTWDGRPVTAISSVKLASLQVTPFAGSPLTDGKALASHTR
jgi:hypothetical protein